MRRITLPWETWRAVISVLREKTLPYLLEHADRLEQQDDRHGSSQVRAVALQAPQRVGGIIPFRNTTVLI